MTGLTRDEPLIPLILSMICGFRYCSHTVDDPLRLKIMRFVQAAELRAIHLGMRTFCYACSKCGTFHHAAAQLWSCPLHAKHPLPPAPLEGWVQGASKGSQAGKKRSRQQRQEDQGSDGDEEASRSNSRRSEPPLRTLSDPLQGYGKDAFTDYLAIRTQKLLSLRLPPHVKLTPALILRLARDEWLTMPAHDREVWLRHARKGLPHHMVLQGVEKDRHHTQGLSHKKLYAIREHRYLPVEAPRCPRTAFQAFQASRQLKTKAAAREWREMGAAEKKPWIEATGKAWAAYHDDLLETATTDGAGGGRGGHRVKNHALGVGVTSGQLTL